MVHRRKMHSESIAPETSFLIEDVEELVNERIDEYLIDKSFKVNIKDYRPAMHENPKGILRTPMGISRIENSEIRPLMPAEREFIGMDLQFSFPLKQADENPLNIALRWSGGATFRLALVDGRAINLIENGDEIIQAAEINKDTFENHLQNIGLPEEIWGSNFEKLFEDIQISRDIKLERRSKELLDIGTTLEVIHSARYMDDYNNDKDLIQELCLNFDFSGPGRREGHLYFPDNSSYRSMLRFERNDKGNSWKYRGAYSGRLVAGELIDEFVQDDPKLGVPNGKLLDKALSFLSRQE